MDTKERRHHVASAVVGLARTLYPRDRRMLKLLGNLQESASGKKFGRALRAVKARGDALERWRGPHGDLSQKFTFSGVVDASIGSILPRSSTHR